MVTEPTNRQRVATLLRENPKGLSKSELRQAIGGNAGAFRRLVASMIDREEIVVQEIVKPECGLTKLHFLPELAPVDDA